MTLKKAWIILLYLEQKLKDQIHMDQDQLKELLTLILLKLILVKY